eukprot:m.101777 g.101777  ORF g.101777 m.101777 type:complete len:150 (+) comp27349_c1_seq1:98-547(+)
MVTLTVDKEYGYIIGLSVAFFFQQQLAFVIPVVRARMATGIKAPTLYPRDSEIKALKLTDEQVHDYYCKQRAHQNNVEFMSVFFPLFMLAGAIPGETMNIFYAGLMVFAFRMLGGLGYSAGLRKYSGFFHIGELFIVYKLGKCAFDMLA